MERLVSTNQSGHQCHSIAQCCHRKDISGVHSLEHPLRLLRCYVTPPTVLDEAVFLLVIKLNILMKF